MVEFKLVVSDPKTGKSRSFELKEENAEKLLGLKIGDKFDGSLISLENYEFEITGGSDSSGFPMKKSIDGDIKRKVIVSKGFGLRKVRKSVKRRRTFAGNTIYEKTAQINAKIIKYGKEPFITKEEEKKEEPQETKE